MHRFFVPPEWINDETVTLSGDVARQLARVLRSRPGDQIIVLDDSGWEYVVILASVTPEQVSGVVTDKTASQGEPNINITLYQGVLKADKFELVVQKGTELGISVFVPVFCDRSVPVERGNPWAANRYPRWRRIITEAAEQSHRGRIPVLKEPSEFAAACIGIEGLGIIPWEQENTTGLKKTLERWKSEGDNGSSVSIFIGPEGGFTQAEIEQARARGIVPVSLGNRILRAETAGIAVAAAVLYELDELGV
jgi:16S rRNA (uracil1498-N3)-methyltransferase